MYVYTPTCAHLYGTHTDRHTTGWRVSVPLDKVVCWRANGLHPWLLWFIQAPSSQCITMTRLKNLVMPGAHPDPQSSSLPLTSQIQKWRLGFTAKLIRTSSVSCRDPPLSVNPHEVASSTDQRCSLYLCGAILMIVKLEHDRQLGLYAMFICTLDSGACSFLIEISSLLYHHVLNWGKSHYVILKPIDLLFQMFYVYS